MKVKDVIKQVAIFLGLTNVMDANLDNFDNLDLQTKKDINLILSSVNEVLCDIATDYLFLQKDILENLTYSRRNKVPVYKASNKCFRDYWQMRTSVL